MEAMTKRKAKPKKQTKKQPRPEAYAPASRCRRCKSSEREPYTGTKTELKFSGFECDRFCGRHHKKEGTDCVCGGSYSLAFDLIVWRRTRCLECGQTRVDKSYEMARNGPEPI